MIRLSDDAEAAARAGGGLRRFRVTYRRWARGGGPGSQPLVTQTLLAPSKGAALGLCFDLHPDLKLGTLEVREA